MTATKCSITKTIITLLPLTLFLFTNSTEQLVSLENLIYEIMTDCLLVSTNRVQHDTQ